MKKKTKKEPALELALLASVSSDFQLAMIKGILEDSSIPYIINDRGGGSSTRLYFGSSIFGTDILINKIDYEKAKELIDDFDFNNNLNEILDDPEEE